MDKLYAIQDVFISVQSALDDVASYGERIKKWVSAHALTPDRQKTMFFCQLLHGFKQV